ncbi:DUF1499 domain-containing protein [Photobacterium minamisatsumaniensis]|uniref:DUF1499 domain-containing protein n=1 Tax=Photobacterium minamisatsumaniensis TaxID=2910233 RepID=UPI003D099229
MIKKTCIGFSTLFVATLISGCSDSSRHSNEASFHYQINQLCGDKPNCVSTLDTREEHFIESFVLSDSGLSHWDQIKQIALTLPGAALAAEADGYFRIENSSSVFRFIDDFEVKLSGEKLDIRSESRVGYSDFGVNRERAEQFRQLLLNAGYLEGQK